VLLQEGDIQFISNNWGDTKFLLFPEHKIVGIVDEIGFNVTT
jgi:D-arabinose 1-dehydrogenase-like Zn-dependent alcohol dehydrogenase